MQRDLGVNLLGRPNLRRLKTVSTITAYVFTAWNFANTQVLTKHLFCFVLKVCTPEGG